MNTKVRRIALTAALFTFCAAPLQSMVTEWYGGAGSASVYAQSTSVSPGKAAYQQILLRIYGNLQLLAGQEVASQFKADWEHKFDAQLDTASGAQSAIEQLAAAGALLGCPATFDGSCLYQRAFNAYLQYHYSDDGTNPNLAEPVERQKWATEWQHKFDGTDAFTTEAGTDNAIRQMRDSLGQRFDYVLGSAGTDSEENLRQAQFGGIGLPVSMRNVEKTVLGGALSLLAHTPDSGSPAYNLIGYGDVLVEIDGAKVDGMTIEQAFDRLSGMPGSLVTLTVRRPAAANRSTLVTVQITRDYMPGSSAGRLAGVGVPFELTNSDLIKVSDGYEVVAGTPDENSPAAGKILAGDYILEIDGKSINGLTLDQALDLVRGPVGSNVTLTISRPGEEFGSTLVFDVVLTRRAIEQHAVHFKDLGGGVSYIKLDQFQSQNVPVDMLNALARAVLPLSSQALADKTDAESQALKQNFDAILSALEEGKLLDQNSIALLLAAVQVYNDTNAGGGLVLDLRGNPGGDLNVFGAVSGMILPHGLVMTTTQRTAGTDQVVVTETSLTSAFTVNAALPLGGTLDQLKVNQTPRFPLIVPDEMPLVVLVDGNSASASELLAGMLQANHRATIIGESTIGKGVGQSVVQLPYGRSLHVTSFEFFPGGIETDWVGVIVDTEVSRTSSEDSQLKAALSEIGQQNTVRLEREKAADESREHHESEFDDRIEDRANEDSKPLYQQDPWRLN